MKKLFRKIKINRNYFLLGLFILVVVIIVLSEDANAVTASDIGYGAWNTVAAIVSSPILIAVGTIAVLVMVLFGALDGLIIAALVEITQYNNFIKEVSIVDSWVIVRDLCNMFFILILLVVAFATILRIESYQWKKILPKLLIMAVLINFSRTITGLIIDASQVIMMTFVNAWGGSGNFVDMTKMAKYFIGTATNDFTNANWSVLKVVSGMLIGIMFLIISGIVLLVAMAVFLMRIIMLWILIVLSPIAFLAAAFPAGQKYATQWWSEFVKYIINGPVLAFFIWMALITSRQITQFGNVAVNQSGTNQCASINLGITQITCLNDFLPFILSIGMLLGGLMITQQIGGIGSSIAGKGLDWAKKAPMLLGKGSLKVGGWASRKLYAHKGIEIRPTKIIQGIREGLKAKAEREEIMGGSKAGALLKAGKLRGATGASRDFTEAAARGFGWRKGWFGKDSVINQARHRGKISKEIDQLQSQLKNENLSEEQKNGINQQIGVKRTEMAKYQPIETFYADEKRNTMSREKMKFFYDSDNEDQLHSTMMNGFNSGQIDIATAAYLQMAKVSHDNEALSKTKALANWYNEKGELRIKEGDFLPVNQDGQRCFGEQYLMGLGGLSEQEMLSFVSQSNTLSKANNHHDLAEGVGSEGSMSFWRTAEAQQKRAAGEFRKGDSESNMRRANRLAHMTEKQVYDPETGEITRVNATSGLTELNFVNNLVVWEKEVNNQKRFNQNAAENFYKNFIDLDKDKGRPEEKKIFNKWERESLVDIGKKVTQKIKDSKDNREITAEQVAWQTLEFGSVEYITNKRVEIESSNLSREEKESKKAELDEEANKYIGIIKENIARLESQRPKKSNPGGATPESKTEKTEGEAEKPKLEGVKPGKISDYYKKRRSKT